MSQANRLIEALAQEGELVSTGEFTIDRDQARAKMRQFQLADPRSYVLQLVQAAVLKGASRIVFEFDTDDMRLSFDGRPFTVEDFDQVYGALFSRREDPATLARRELALGLNGAMALNPRFVRVASGDGRTGAWLELQADRPDAFGPLDADPPTGTRIHVRQRFRLGLVVQFFRLLQGELAENRYLRHHCRWSRVPVWLEQGQVGGAPTWADPALVRTAVEGEGLTGEAVLFGPAEPTADPSGPDVQPAPASDPATQVHLALEGEEQKPITLLRDDDGPRAVVHLLTSGVLISSRYSELLPRGLVAVVDGQRLHKDVSQASIVRDEAYQRLVEVVGRAGDRLLEQLCVKLRENSLNPAQRDWARELLCRAARDRVSALTDYLTGPPPGPTAAGLPSQLCFTPLWSAADEGPRLSLAQLIEHAGTEGPIRFSDCAFPGTQLPEGGPVLLLADRNELGFFRALCASRLVDAQPQLRRAQKRERARQEFLSRTYEPDQYQRVGFRLREELHGPGVTGWIGLAGPDATGRLTLVTQGSRLDTRRWDEGLAGCEAVLIAQFQPNDHFNRAAPTSTLARALLIWLEGQERLARRWAEQLRSGASWAERQRLISFILWATNPSVVRDTLGLFGFSWNGLQDLVREEHNFHVLPLVLLGPEATAHHPLAEVPLCPTTAEQPLSLAELGRRGQEQGWLAYLSEPPPATFRPDPPLLVLTERPLLELLERLLGRDRLRESNERLRHHAAEQRFRAQPTERLALPGPHRDALAVGHDHVRGLVALTEPRSDRPQAPGSWSTAGQLRVLLDHRLLELRPLPGLPLTGVAAVLDSDRFTSAPTWDRVVEDEAYQQALGALGAAIQRLIRLQVARLPFTPADTFLSSWLLEVATAALPSPLFRRTWEQLWQELGSTAAAPCFQRILWLAQSYPLGRVEAALQSARQLWEHQPDPVDPPLDELLAARLQPERRPTDADLALLQPWFRPSAEPCPYPIWPELLDVALFPADRSETALRSLGDVLREFRATGHVEWLDHTEPGEAADTLRQVRLSPEQHAILGRRLFTTAELIDGRPRLQTHRLERELRARPLVESLTLPPGVALVTRTLAEEQVQGEVGLAAVHPGATPPSRLDLCLERHHLQTVVQARPVGLVALLDDRTLPLRPAPELVAPGDIERLFRRCERLILELLAELAAHWDTLPATTRDVAWRHLLDHFAATLAGSRAVPDRLLGEPMNTLVKVPGFTGANGQRYNLRELARSCRQTGRIRYLTAPSEPIADRSERTVPDQVLLVDPHTLQRLQTIFEPHRLVDHLPEWQTKQEQQRRREAAPLLRQPTPPELLVETGLRGAALQGVLYLPSDPRVPLEVIFGQDGREVERRNVSRCFPVAGVITGPGVRATAHWNRVELEPTALPALESAALGLYRSLLPKLAELDAAGVPEAEVARQYLRRLRETLWQVPEGGWPVGQQKAIRRLKKQLAPLDLTPRLHTSLIEAEPPASAAEAEAAAEAQTTAASAAEPGRGPTAPAAAAPTPPLHAPLDRTLPLEVALVRALRARIEQLRPASDPLRARLLQARLILEALPGDPVAESRGPDLFLNTHHPLVRRALGFFAQDPPLLTYLLSALATAVNQERADISDADERAFQTRLIREVSGSP